METVKSNIPVHSLTRLNKAVRPVKSCLILLRPKHWVKNLFLFVPLFFSGHLFQRENLSGLLLGFISFCIIASSIYVINDLRDIESDQKHPEKCKRPLASGAISKNQAIILFIICMLAGFLLAFFIQPKFLFILSIYFFLNLGYSFGLKNISILDILIVSAGFVLRIKAGGAIAFIAISHWLMIMVFLLALFMAIAKRRDDILLKLSSGRDMRKAIKGYNLDFLNTCLALVSAVIIVAYLMYTVSPEVIQRLGTYKLYYTSLFVIAGLMRYLQLTYVEKDSGSPTKLLYKDRFLQITILLWLISFYFLIYFPEINLFDHVG